MLLHALLDAAQREQEIAAQIVAARCQRGQVGSFRLGLGSIKRGGRACEVVGDAQRFGDAELGLAAADIVGCAGKRGLEMWPRLARRAEIEMQPPGQQRQSDGVGVFASKRQATLGILERGGEPACLAQPLGRDPIGLGGPRVAGTVEVLGAQLGFAIAQPVGRTAMQAARRLRQQRGVGRFLDQRVGEHQDGAFAYQQSAVDQWPRIVRGLVRQAPAAPAAEALAQHRCRLQGGPVGPPQPVEPGLHQATDGARQRRRFGLRGTQRQLLQEQRIAARASHEAGDLSLVDHAGRSLGQAPHGVTAKRSQLDHDQRCAAELAAERSVQRIALRPRRRQQHQRPRHG